MNQIGILPEPDAILSTSTIPLFGILTPPASEDEDCHICLEPIKKQLFIVKLPCCGHQTHSECFKTWALTSLNETKIRCAYCRSELHYEKKCFLCLKQIEDKNVKWWTSCCNSKVHSECATEIADLSTVITYEHNLACGQLSHCNCIWVHV